MKHKHIATYIQVYFWQSCYQECYVQGQGLSFQGQAFKAKDTKLFQGQL